MAASTTNTSPNTPAHPRIIKTARNVKLSLNTIVDNIKMMIAMPTPIARYFHTLNLGSLNHALMPSRSLK